MPTVPARFYSLTMVLTETPYRFMMAASLAMLLGPAAGQQSSASLDDYDFESEPEYRWKLPERLTEVSGLAVGENDRIFAHDDELGLVYEINIEDESIEKTFSLGERPVPDDFEGMAIAGERFFLVASTGRIYEFSEGADDEHVPYRIHDTGIGGGCDIEGLAFEPADRTLLLICKKTGKKDGEKYVVIYKWSPDRLMLMEEATILLPLKDFTRHIKGKAFHPSGIERHPRTGHYFIVAAREAAIAEVTPDGDVLEVKELSRRLHRQAEGIALTSSLDLYITDEGGDGRARLTGYYH